MAVPYTAAARQGAFAPFSVRADYAEQEILTRLQNILSHPQLVDDVCTSMSKKLSIDKTPLKEELRLVDKELADIDRKKEKYFKLFEDDLLKSQSLKEKLTDIDKSKQQLQKRKVELESQLSGSNSDKTVSEEVVRGILSEFMQLFDKLSNEKRKQLVHAVIKRITVTEDRKIDTIELKFDNSKYNYIAI
jgi:site-specific DNA recombinase